MNAFNPALSLAVALAVTTGSAAAQSPGTDVTRSSVSISEFAAADSDRDGRLSPAEFERYQHAAARGFDGTDRDADGYVTFVETWQVLDPDTEIALNNVDSMRDVFLKSKLATYDRDGDGAVSLREAVGSSVVLVTPRAIYDYDAADADHDGNLDEAEFGAFQEAVGRDRGS